MLLIPWKVLLHYRWYIYIYSTAQCSALPNWQEILLVNGTAKQRQTTQSPTNHRLEYLSGPFVPVVYWVVPQQRCCAPISRTTGTTCFDWDRTGSFIESVWSLVLANTCKLKYYIFVENFLFLFCFRSATLVLAYLMKYQRMNLIDAHSYVKQRRPLIRPNSGFWKDLVEFEKKLFHKNTVNMVESKIGGYIPAYSVYTSLMCILLW